MSVLVRGLAVIGQRGHSVAKAFFEEVDPVRCQKMRFGKEESRFHLSGIGSKEWKVIIHYHGYPHLNASESL